MAYTHAYYVFGTSFNDLFLLHAAVFATSVFAMVLVFASLHRVGSTTRSAR